MATKGAAISMVSFVNPTAMAFVKSAGRRFTSSVISKMIERKIKNMFTEKTALCRVLAKAGMKTCVKAPSAKIRRKRFGSLNAIKNISLYMFAPSAEAVSKSRINPKILEMRIPKLFVNIALNIGFFIDILLILLHFNKDLVKINPKINLHQSLVYS